MAQFSAKQLRGVVSDLFERSPGIYWTDAMLSIGIGYAAATVYTETPLFSPIQLAAYVLTVLALYRASSFMHEISHMRRDEMKGFKTTWNIVGGVPMMVPSFLYETHLDHHNTHHYGTDRDGEYLPLANQGLRGVIAFLVQPLFLPALTYIRFLIVTPLSLLIPSMRKWVLEHWTSFVINFRYRRPIRPRDPVNIWLRYEIACCCWAWLMIILTVVGFKHWYWMGQLYLIAVGILYLNHLRTLVAHRYRGDGETMSHEEQFFDSTDVVGPPGLIAGLCPVGLRYHALHHLIPALPYHNLGKAHRRLMAELPLDSPYRQCVYPNPLAVVGELFEEIARRRASRAIARNEQLVASSSPSQGEQVFPSTVVPERHSAGASDPVVAGRE